MIRLKNALQGPKFAILALLLSGMVSNGYSKSLQVIEEKPVAKDSQVKELGGLILLDSTVEVSGVLRTDKYITMVEVSTPSVPSTNRINLFLRADGTNQALVLQWPDGATTVLGSH